MTRPQAVIGVTIVALVFAGLASWGVYSFLSKESRKAKAAAVQPLVVAAGEIAVGTKLDISQLKTVSMTSDTYPKGGFRDPKDLVGRVAIRFLSPGDQITESKLIPKEGSQPSGVMTYIVPKGHRAVTVAVNEVAGVAGFLAPNNRVDIVLTTPIPNDPKNETISKIVLQNVTVLATGQITEQKEGKPAVVPTVTLDLMPADAEKLVHASHKGSLQLLLRNVVDIDPVTETRGTTIYKVLGGVESPAPLVAKAPAAPRSPRVASKPVVKTSAPAAHPTRVIVEIIKGKERSTKEFAE